MQYFVVAPDGTSYGPADMPTLQQWAAEGRILPDSMIRNASTGQSQLASSIPGLIPGPAYGTQTYSQSPIPNYMQQPGPGLSNYPRGYANQGRSGDVQTGWILGVVGIVMALCCSLVGLICGIIGVVIANRAYSAGNLDANGPRILCWIAIVLSIASMVLGFLLPFATRF